MNLALMLLGLGAEGGMVVDLEPGTSVWSMMTPVLVAMGLAAPHRPT
jgi:hypothetical protein